MTKVLDYLKQKRAEIMDEYDGTLDELQDLKLKYDYLSEMIDDLEEDLESSSNI